MMRLFMLLAFVSNLGLAIYLFHFEAYWHAAINFAVAIFVLVQLLEMEVRIYREREADRRFWQRHDEAMRLIEVRSRVYWGGNFQHYSLAACLHEGVCPDCGNRSLDRETLTCSDPTCGSRFSVDAAGKWDRVE